MSDLYRITGEPAGQPPELQDLIQDGWLVPAEPCVHGNYARHLVRQRLKGAALGEWCDGQPKGDT